jgi:hypothetical protein
MVRLVAPIVAVVAVAVVVLVVFKINGHSSGNEPGPGVVAATTPSVQPKITFRTAPPSTTPSPSTASSPKHTAKPPPAKAKPKPDQTAMAPVRVYNSTTITGLAHHVASEVEARGWDVIDVGNVSGGSSLTTLYYAPGLRAAAQHLASELSGIRQVEPAQGSGISFSGLTLILTADWHD